MRRNGGDDVDEDDDDRDEDALRAAEDRLRRDMSTKDGAIVRALEGLNSRLDKMDERDRERSDSAKIKQHPLFRSWVTDDHITLARERKASHGGSLEDNFKLLFFDEIPKVVEREVTSRIPAEMRRSLISTDNEPVVIDGVRMTEERLQELRDNPDEYAKVRKAIRAAKRRRSGKLPYPGRE